MGNKLTTEQFIEKAKKVHGDKYGYKETEYQDYFTKVKIKCNSCHESFWQEPRKHLAGNGCPYCAKKARLKTQEEFIKRANIIFGGKYLYTETAYTRSCDKIKIICPDHGPFWQVAESHLQGHGCPKCVSYSEIPCVICDNTFIPNAPNAKVCSKECFDEHRRNCRKKNTKTIICLYCGKEHICGKDKKTRFCSQSCGSKWNYENGNGSKGLEQGHKLAQENKDPNRFFDKECFVCGKTYKVRRDTRELENNRSKTCSRKCRTIYMKEYMSGENNPSFGKKETKQAKEKRQETLVEKYGITNAFYLAKHEKVSKPQKELRGMLEEAVKSQVLIEHKISSYMVDIFLPENNLVIEFYGDYYHANPKIYDAEYYNKKKGLLAREIWAQDKKRLSVIKKLGYKTYVIWENNWKQNKEETFEGLIAYLKKCEEK